MASDPKTAFLIYCREDSDFALKLAQDLRSDGVEVWIDLLKHGEDFYHAVQEAPIPSCRVLAILSPAARTSDQFNRQLTFAAGQRKTVVPVIYKTCEVPYILTLEEPVDLSADYDEGRKVLQRLLGVPQLTPEEDRQRAQEIYAGIAEHAKMHAAERAKIQDDLTAAILRVPSNEPAAPEAPTQANVPGAGANLGELFLNMEKGGSFLEPLGPIRPPFDGKLTLPGYNLEGIAEQPVAFVSYSRTDGEFVSKLAADLKKAGAKIWMDKLDLRPGQDWDQEIEGALERCARVLVILSPASVDSRNVRAEINEALDTGKQIVPVIYRQCKIPFRLKPFQCADFSGQYEPALEQLLDTLLGR